MMIVRTLVVMILNRMKLMKLLLMMKMTTMRIPNDDGADMVVLMLMAARS